MDEQELKAQSAARRRAWLEHHRDGLRFDDRIHAPKTQYRRRPKHRPRAPEDWEQD